MLQKVKRNGMLTIPKEIREKANIEDGTYVLAGVRGDEIIFKIVDPTTLLDQLQSA